MSKNHRRLIVVAIAVAVLAGCSRGGGPQPSATSPSLPSAVPPTNRPATARPATATPRPVSSQPTTPPIVPTQDSVDEAKMPSWLRVYFTVPVPPDQYNDTKSIDKVVIDAINGAQTKIDIASFDFNLPNMVDALVAAVKRGVAVRVVVDAKEGAVVLSDQAAKIIGGRIADPLTKLKDNKVQVVDGGRSSGLMHNKMVIIDGATMYIGSWNVSFNDTFRNDNNILRITSRRIITNYERKFDEMFVSKLFGSKAKVGAFYPQLSFTDAPVENYFSPPDGVMARLVNEVNAAKSSVKFMAFTFTSADLANAMIARAKARVRVSGVIENRGASQGALPSLFCARLPVRTDGNSYTMHHKVIIIDDETVITGSYNFTKSADTINDDNVIIIRNKALAALYLKEFDRVYGLAKTPENVTCN